MTLRHALLALAVASLAQPAGADNARSRSGGHSDSRSVGTRHTPSPHSSGRTSNPSADASGRGASATPGLSDAQRRHPRPRPGGVYRPGRGYYYSPYYRSYYYPYYYPYGSAYWWPYSGFYSSAYFGYGYPYWYGYGPAYHRVYRDSGALRLLVDPAEARVYVDGYYAGVVDDFDGLFQRLHVSPGRHEIALKLEGYRPHRMRVYAAPGSTLKIHYHLEKGSGEETFEDLAGSAEERDWRSDAASGPDDERWAGDEDRRPRDERADRQPRGEVGRLRLDVRPDDASVYVDGQFKGTGRQVGVLELSPGPHRVEIVRPGFRTEEREVDIDGDETRLLEIELSRP